MSRQESVTIVTDLGFGDAGKGSVTDYLGRQGAVAVVRFNGGGQAAHNVVTPDHIHHTFRQFGSASFVPGIKTHLSRFMLVSPLHLWNEAMELTRKGVPDAIFRISIDEDALIVSPYQEAGNRIREALREDNRHGSCGMGIGETMADSLEHPTMVLRAKDLMNPGLAKRKLEFLRQLKLQEFQSRFGLLKGITEVRRDIESLLDAELSQSVVEFYATFCSHVQIVSSEHLGTLLKEGPVIFEGAQGVLLDEWFGFHPYTTWSTTTNANADQLLQEQGYDGPIKKLGLLRGYATRHGRGPFVSEDKRLSQEMPDLYNPTNPWQQDFRVGHFDYVMARYALDVVGQIDGLVISNLDSMYGQADWKVCTAYTSDTGQRVTTLKPSVVPDLNYQAGLTQQLLSCQPVLESFNKGRFGPEHIDSYIQEIERTLELPVVLTSTGPTAYDKEARL
jgi:adenylosuccinate synthase